MSLKVSTDPITNFGFVPGLNIAADSFSVADLSDSESVVAAFLQENIPNLDFSNSSSLYDLIVRPVSISYLAVRRMVETNNRSSSIKGLEDYPELADSELISGVLSKFLMDLDSGAKASGMIRVEVSSSRVFSLQRGAAFITESGLEFSLDDSIVTSTTSTEGRTPLLQPDPSKEIWEFYIPVTSVEVGSEYNVAKNTQFTSRFPINNVIRSTAASAFSGGEVGEEISGIRQRILDSLAARNLVSRSSIFSTLKDNFPGLTAVNIQGMGDPLIFRNRTTVLGTPIGGVVDVYVKTTTAPTTYEVEMEASPVVGSVGEYSVEVGRDAVPGHYLVTGIRPNGGSFAGTYEITSQSRQIDNVVSSGSSISTTPNRMTSIKQGAFSRWQKTVVTFTVQSFDPTSETGESGKLPVIVAVLGQPNIKEIQEFISAEDVRVGGTDFLIRSFIPAFLGTSEIRVRIQPTSEISEDEVRSAVVDYVNSIPPTHPVRVDGVVGKIKSLPGVLDVDLPINLTCTVFSPDESGEVTVASSKSSLLAPYSASKGIGPENTIFFAEPGAISIIIS